AMIFCEVTPIMFDAAVKALSQMFTPELRRILWRAVGLALILIAVVAIMLQRLLSWFATSGESWAEASFGAGYHSLFNTLAWIVSIAAGFGILFGAVF